MAEVFARHIWLLKNLGVGGGKRWRFLIIQALVWSNSISLFPSVLSDAPLTIRCLVLACSLVSAGSGFKLTQLRRHAVLLKSLLDELSEGDGSTGMITSVRKVSKIYVSFILMLLCAWLAYPWLRGDLEMPLHYWTPFDLEEDFFYFCLVYGIASLGLVVVAYTQEAVDTLVLLIAALICRKLDKVNCMLTELGTQDWQKIHCKGMTDNEILSSAISEHVDSIRIIRSFDKLVSDIFLVQVLQTTVVSTISFFSASKIGDLQEVPKFLMIVSATYMQFYIFCWMGEEISGHSNGLHRAIYQSNWYDCSLDLKKSINRFETFSKFNFRMKGGRIFTIHLETFLLMMKESFSAFMVMRAVAQ